MKIIAALSFISFSPYSTSQEIDMTSIVGLQNQLNGQVNDDFSDESDDEDEKLKNRLIIDPNQFEAKDYGYNGENSFNVSPKSKNDTSTMNYFGYDFFFSSPSSFLQEKNISPPID